MTPKAKDALSKSEVATELQHLPGWSAAGKASLSRTFKNKDFLATMKLANAVAAIAQRMDHHPDMNIQYDKLTFTLSSHDAGGVSGRDVKLAGKIDAAAEKSGAKG